MLTEPVLGYWNHLSGDTDVCPVTGLAREDEFRQAGTDRDRPGLFNICYRCGGDGVPLGQKLRVLNDSRATLSPSGEV